MFNIPENLRYTASHEWVFEEEGIFTIGLTDFAQDSLGDLVFVSLPQVGDEIVAGESFSDVESVKAVSDIFSPVSGTIVEVNEELADAPELINEDPYGAWLVRVGEVTESEDLLAAEAYAEVCENEE
ncbi:MAG TPA: glycine cleavage system protein GcvH [Atopobiaceae bacterium]|nr:glycine cleavage system protein GcvH [Atopobiaceae bacterium]